VSSARGFDVVDVGARVVVIAWRDKTDGILAVGTVCMTATVVFAIFGIPIAASDSIFFVVHCFLSRSFRFN